MAVGKRERKGTHIGGEEDILYLPCVTPHTQVSNTFFLLTVTWLRQLNAVETSQMYFDLDQKADMAEHYVSRMCKGNIRRLDMECQNSYKEIRIFPLLVLLYQTFFSQNTRQGK